MSSDWTPKLVAPQTRAPESAPNAQPEPLVVHVKAPDTPTPKGWRFIPHRDQNNLIDEIIATPIF
jgi:hypothetical protein